MGIFIKYTLLQLKRTLSHMGSFLITSVLLLLSMAVLVFLLSGQSSAAADKDTRVRVGLVRDEDDAFMGMALRLLEGMESISNELELVEMTENEAEAALENGETAAYLVVPPGFIESIMSGENKKILCVTGGSSSGLLSVIMDGMMDALSKMLLESQNAVYGMQDALVAAGAADTLGEDIDRLNMEYFSLITDRSELFELRTGDYRRGLSNSEYYFCSLTVLFLLLISMGGMRAFVRKELSFERLLRRRGLGAAGQVLSEYISCFFLSTAGTIPVLLLFWLLARRGIFFDGVAVLSELSGLGRFFVSMLPAVCLTASVHYLIFSCARGPVDCALAEGIYALVSAYCAGCMLPSSFLPPAIRSFGAMLPTGRALAALQDLTAGASGIRELPVLLLMTLGILLLSALIRAYRLDRNDG